MCIRDRVSIAAKTFGVCDFSRLAVTDWRLRRWRLWFLALMTATPSEAGGFSTNHMAREFLVVFWPFKMSYKSLF